VVYMITLRVNLIPVTQRPYRTNLKISQRIQEEFKNFLDVVFIYVIKHIDQVSPIVCVLK